MILAHEVTETKGTAAAMPLLKLIPIQRCRNGGGIFIEYDGRELAVFLLDESRQVFVTDNACPHAAGNLSAGKIDGRVVTCPTHNWQFDLNRAACVHTPNVRLRRYNAEIRDGFVWVDLPKCLKA